MVPKDVYVTAMERDLLCGDFIEDAQFVVRVEGAWPPKRKKPIRDFLICSNCWRPGPSYVTDDGPFAPTVFGLWGDGEPVIGPCAGCGVRVMRGSDPRMKYLTCSTACTVKASKEAHAASTRMRVAEVCAGCGDALDGRTDRRYCSSACRQKVYRQRRRPSLP